MRSYIAFLILILFACTKSKIQVPKNSSSENKTFQKTEFKEIGNKELPLLNFSKHWYVQIYDEMDSMNKEDSTNQKNMEQLDFFDEIKGKHSDDTKFKKIVLKNEKFDSLFLVDSFSIENRQIFYVKYFKTINDSNYDSPLTENNIDVLIFDNDNLKKRINVYSNKNYPFAVEKKIGYLNKEGNLYMKTFEIDEEGVTSTTQKIINCNEYLK